MSKPNKYETAWDADQERAELAEEARAHECPHCGEVGGLPCDVECRDDSVGYYDIEQRCSLCVGES